MLGGIATDEGGCGGWLKKKETRIGGRDPGLRGMRVGGTRMSHELLLGQRITVAPAASATAQAVTKVFAGAVQLVT